MVRKYRNTLKAHAHALASLGGALANLASEHRVAASALELGQPLSRQHSQFSDWIAATVEISAAAERLLELEVELARRHGLTWEQVAEALGVSRQSAWERFRTHSRWDRASRLSQLRRARRASMLRRMALGQGEEFLTVLRWMMGVERSSTTVDRMPVKRVPD